MNRPLLAVCAAVLLQQLLACSRRCCSTHTLLSAGRLQTPTDPISTIPIQVEVKSKFNLGNNLAVFDNKIRTLNQGHFGVNGCYEGARRPRSGFIEAFKDCEYEKQIMKTFG